MTDDDKVLCSALRWRCGQVEMGAADRIEALAGEVERLAAELDAVTTHRFPILGGAAIPWSVIAPCEAQARLNHAQTLVQLAGRGGLAPAEAVAVLEGRRLAPMPAETAKLRLAEIVTRRQSNPRAERAEAEVERLKAAVSDALYLRISIGKLAAIAGIDSHNTALCAGETLAEAERDALRAEVERLKAITVEQGSRAMCEADRARTAGNANMELRDQVKRLEAEVKRLKAERDKCPTCGGDGIVDVLVRVLPPDGREEYEPAECAECNGYGVSAVGQAFRERDALRAEVARLTVNPNGQSAATPESDAEGRYAYADAVLKERAR